MKVGQFARIGDAAILDDALIEHIRPASLSEHKFITIDLLGIGFGQETNRLRNQRSSIVLNGVVVDQKAEIIDIK